MKSDTVYEYKKVKPIDMARAKEARDTIRVLMNKINELCIEQNHLMKDFELYKKAFKQHVREGFSTGTNPNKILSEAVLDAIEEDIKITPIGKNIQMRGDGRLEWVCKHGIGHTIAVPTNWPKPPKDKPDYRYIHGCDGCCSIYERKQVGHI